MLVKLFNRHGLVPQPTAKCDFLSNTARQFTQANAELLRHSLRQQRPFFSAVRRRSCQPPSRKIPLPTSRLSRQTESHTSPDQHNVLPLAESVGRTRREVFIDEPSGEGHRERNRGRMGQKKPHAPSQRWPQRLRSLAQQRAAQVLDNYAIRGSYVGLSDWTAKNDPDPAKLEKTHGLGGC
jgi:hypothetical protein